MLKSLYLIGSKANSEKKTATFLLKGLHQVVWKEREFTYLFEKTKL